MLERNNAGWIELQQRNKIMLLRLGRKGKTSAVFVATILIKHLRGIGLMSCFIVPFLLLAKYEDFSFKKINDATR